MNEQPENTTKSKRRWLKVSLRTFLLAITVLCVWLGFIVNRANKQKHAVAWVRENGGTVHYDFEWDDGNGSISDAKPPGPDWLRERIGIDYFADVSHVWLNGEEITDLAPLAVFSDLHRLYLIRTSVSDLSALTHMRELQELYLIDSPVSDLAPLSGNPGLRRLHLAGTDVEDLSPLVGFKHILITIRWGQKNITIPQELESQVNRF